MSYYIYKICCDDLPDFVYVGSTKAFRNRKKQHKNCCNNDNNKLYQTIRENGGWENWRMVVIEECGEISFIQARIKEEEHRVKLNANLNMIRCHQTEEQKKERQNEWNENNKERIKENKNEYYENNKEKIKKYKKEWSENNKEKVYKQHNDWYKVKIICECGREVARGGLSRHKKTIFHKNYISNI